MAKTLIFEERAVPFALNSTFGVYMGIIDPPVFALEKGETYTILWDGVEYVCVGDDITLNGMYLQGVGNRALQGGENTGEPFAIASAQNDGAPYYNAMMSTDTAASHTVAIWHGAEDAAIVLKDRDGNPAQFQGATAVNLLMQDGTEQLFIPETDIPVAVEKTVSPDFSGGDMVVVPADGSVLSKVTVQKPANLIPGNIAEGVDIAGIIGTLVAGGGSGVIASAVSVKGSGTVSTVVTHGLGVVPDIVFAYASTTGFSASSSYNFCVIGCSTAAKNAGIKFPLNYAFHRNSSSIGISSKIYGIEYVDDPSTGFPIHSANAETVTLNWLSNSYTYFVYCIGGLT